MARMIFFAAFVFSTSLYLFTKFIFAINAEILLPHGSTLFSKMVPMDPSRPFPPVPPPTAVNFPQTGMIVPNSSYQPVQPVTQSGIGPKSTGNLFPTIGVGSAVVGMPPSYPAVSSLSTGGGGAGVGVAQSGDSSGNVMSSSQRGPPDQHQHQQQHQQQQQQQIIGQGRSNAISLNSSSSSAAYIPSSSFTSTSTPAVSQQQQFRQHDQSQMPFNEVPLKVDAASGVRTAAPVLEALPEPPKKVFLSSRYFAFPEYQYMIRSLS